MATKIIQCVDCTTEFEFSDGEQEFYEKKGLYPPKRCSGCRAKKRAEKENQL